MTDSYKVSHWKQYPPNTEYIYSYLEARNGETNTQFPNVLFFGLQYYLKKYLEGIVVTSEHIKEAEEYFSQHFSSLIFNKEGWEYIINKHGGKLPVSIKAVPEGTIVPRGNVLVTVENTDPKCFWLTNYLETLLVQIWYACTVATQSYEMKKIITKYLELTGDLSLVDFKLHDFGYRGVSSVETAGIGGCAHLVNFKGTDTMAALEVAKKYYNCPMAGFSIPAAEHSTIISWGKDKEREAYANMLEQYPTGLVAVVSDSYDISNACSHIWGEELKDKVLTRDGVLVVRPDSGIPHVTVPLVLSLLGKKFGYETNNKGYFTLNPKVRVIQGDGIDINSLEKILAAMHEFGWSADNIAFGSGGGLLQKLNRDTCSFAFKCSAITVDGKENNVFKKPATDPTKVSKAGRLKLVNNKTVNIADPGEDSLVEVFRNGNILKEYTLDEIRNSNNSLK